MFDNGVLYPPIISVEDWKYRRNEGEHPENTGIKPPPVTCRTRLLWIVSWSGRQVSRLPGTERFGHFVDKYPLLGVICVVVTTIFMVISYERRVGLLVINSMFYVGMAARSFCPQNIATIVRYINEECYVIVWYVLITVWVWMLVWSCGMFPVCINGGLYFVRGLGFSYKPSIKDDHHLNMK